MKKVGKLLIVVGLLLILSGIAMFIFVDEKNSIFNISNNNANKNTSTTNSGDNNSNTTDNGNTDSNTDKTSTLATDEIFNTYKNDITTINNASNSFEADFSTKNISKEYYTEGTSNSPGTGSKLGLCITVKGLIENGYLDQQYSQYTGFLLLERPYYGANGEQKNIISIYKDDIVSFGIEYDYLMEMTYSDFTDFNRADKPDKLKGFVDDVLNGTNNSISSYKDGGGLGVNYGYVKCIDELISE